MLYEAYEVGSDLAAVTRLWGGWLQIASSPWLNHGEPRPAMLVAAAGEMLSRAGLTHRRPAYGVVSAPVGNRAVPVVEEAADATPFGQLIHFVKDVETRQPKVLLVAPLSGHFATLLRGTIRTLVADHDVYVTDWANARDVPVAAGRFGFDDYVDHLVRFLETIGPGAHVVAVCQPAVQALAAAALMAEAGHAAAPASLTLMAGPVDTSVNPTKVNELAVSRPISWFENRLISTVPERHLGRGRRVYPGFIQLAAFASMNAQRHVKAHVDLYWHLAMGETVQAEQIKSFYDEYNAVLDLPAEFYLETIKTIFQDNALGRDELRHRGRRLDMRAIRRTALMTVEGERDDICSVGQTVAAHDLCSGLKPYMKRHHLQPGVGHYGVFSGRKWEAQIYPVVRNFILAND